MPAHEIPSCEGFPPSLNEVEERLLAELRPGCTSWFTNRTSLEWGGDSPFNIARRLVAKGLASETADRRFSPIPYDVAEAAKPDWMWLPNTIVSGASDETPPVHLLRQAQNPVALRLFVDLYNSHGLAEDGGVHWRQIRENYTRHRVGQRGPFVVWGFQASNCAAWGVPPFVAPHLTGRTEEVEQADGSKKRRDIGWKPFWEAWSILVGLGLVELVGHVIEADNDTAEVVHPYAIDNGEADERELAATAKKAAEALLTTGQIEWAKSYALNLLPASVHRLPNVQLVGIARLRYRPHTKATAAWAAKKREWDEWAKRYRELAEQTNAAESNLQHQGNIKVGSR
jgi:hypothetical protein